jgi:hypothetical protein
MQHGTWMSSWKKIKNKSFPKKKMVIIRRTKMIKIKFLNIFLLPGKIIQMVIFPLRNSLVFSRYAGRETEIQARQYKF